MYVKWRVGGVLSPVLNFVSVQTLQALGSKENFTVPFFAPGYKGEARGIHSIETPRGAMHVSIAPVFTWSA